jgi:hypothetical protein
LSRCRRRAMRTRSAPREVNSRAHAVPIPDEARVTSAVRLTYPMPLWSGHRCRDPRI